ncbi:MAG: PAS domain-containing protein, partial [Methanomicrobiales archaeon]|nr:PAS domain-containing protein [Methanomicrobiales archaeon]
PVIFLSANSDDATVSEALSSEPFGYLTKPVNDRSLHTAIRMALYKYAMEMHLRRSEEQFRLIADLLGESLYLIARNYTIRYVNRCGAELTGRHADDVVGKPVTTVLPESISRALTNAVARVFETGTTFIKTGRYEFNGSVVWLETTILPFHKDDGKVVTVLGISRDISDRILLEEEMNRKGLIQLEKNMEQFQVLNDKIRNPLQVIAVMATLEKTPNNEKILKQVAVIDDLIDQLDKGWAESRKVRSFLLRHYGHGEALDGNRPGP